MINYLPECSDREAKKMEMVKRLRELFKIGPYKFNLVFPQCFTLTAQNNLKRRFQKQLSVKGYKFKSDSSQHYEVRVCILIAVHTAEYIIQS